MLVYSKAHSQKETLHAANPKTDLSSAYPYNILHSCLSKYLLSN